MKIEKGNRLVIGKNSVREVLRHAASKVECLISVKDPKGFLLESGLDYHGPMQKIDSKQLSILSNSENHQGLALIVRQPEERKIKQVLSDLKNKESLLLVVLSEVNDPHHLGAIFRACEAFGVDLLVFPDDHSAQITPIVTKVAVGATELVTYCREANINEALRKIKQAGIWVAAAEPSATATYLDKFAFPSQLALVFGAEGQGLSRLTLELSDFQVAIRQAGQIDSLSLSQAVAVMLYQAEAAAN